MFDYINHPNEGLICAITVPKTVMSLFFLMLRFIAFLFLRKLK